MKNRASLLSTENLLYLAVFGLALALRLYRLGAYPLAEAEAREALLAFQWGRGAPALGLPYSPAYFFVTALGFFVLGAGETLARLAPALVGASLVLLPALYRDRLGRAAALVASGLLALSPGMVAASRTIDGAVLALAGLGWGLGVFRRYLAERSLAWLMLSAGLLGFGLASGAPFLTGALVVLAAALLVAWRQPEERQKLQAAWGAVQPVRLVFFVTLGVTALLVATLGLTYLPGLGALAASWQAWLVGFLPSAAGRAPWLWGLFFPAYEPLAVVFGLVGAGLVLWGRTDTPAITEADAAEAEAALPASPPGAGAWLLGLVLAALLLGLVYGGRIMPMVIWVSAPLAALAACGLVEIARRLWTPGEWLQVVVQVALLLALFVFAALRLAVFVVEGGVSAGPINLNLALAVLAVLMAGGLSLLFGAGWSWKTAGVGASLGVGLAALVLTVNAGWGLTQVRPASPVELWWPAPTDEALLRLVQSVSRISNYSTGSDADVALMVQTEPPGTPGWGLRWAFREFPHAVFVPALDAQVNSAVVVAPATAENPALGSAYVGQAFTFQRAWSPAGFKGVDWVAWWLYRRGVPQEADKLILWVRQDVQQLQVSP